MGLESATHIQDFDGSNPLAGDKKNQGDDHLRLIKTVLKTDFPNADRPFRFPEALAKTGNYTILTTDDNKTIVCDASGGLFTLTLPTPTIDGWLVNVVKTDTGANPVYVVPPSGTINGFAKIRVNIPFVVHTFVWTGSVFLRLNPPNYCAGKLEAFGHGALSTGFAQATGQSLLRADYPELFAAWGTTWGSVDGTHFNAPDLQDRFIIGVGFTNAAAASGGEASHTLTEAELPNLTKSLASGATSGGNITGTADTALITSAAGGGGPNVVTFPGTPGSNDAFNISVSGTYAVGTATGTISFGSGQAHENRPPFKALWYGFGLC